MSSLFFKQDNIVAEITPQGENSAVSGIRISGKNAKESVESTFFCKLDKPRYAYYVKTNIDDVVIIFYKEPNSYTGENACEIFCHGNKHIVSEIIQNLLNNTCFKTRLAEAGEFTRRSYLNGKMNLIEAQSVIDIINANNIFSIKASKAVLSGNLSKELELISKDLKEMLILAELDINFIEDEQTFDYILAKEKTKRSIRKLTKLLSRLETNENLSRTNKVILIGNTNVGKSSLFNELLGFERSLIDINAGTTRDYIENRVVIQKQDFVFIDTAGFRDNSKDSIERMGMNLSKDLLKEADIVIEIADDPLFKYNEFSNIKVLNKVDLLNSNLQKLGSNVIFTSAKTGFGITSLKEKIYDVFTSNIAEFKEKEALMSVSKSTLNKINDLKDMLEKTDLELKQKTSIDIIVFFIKESLLIIEKMFGEKLENEDIVNSIFSQFCVGK